MRIPISFLLMLLSSVVCYAQKEANEWYFSTMAGMSFKNGAPIPIYDGKLVSMEGCGSISDKNGKLLFYSDGQNVWNSKHLIMANGKGLIGGAKGTTSGSSAAQGVMIVPDPANFSRYYIFIAPDVRFSADAQKTDKLSVYIVDMSLNNGLGDVLPGLIQLNTSSEKLTGTLDCFGTGYWVVSHHTENNEFYSYHISKDGLDPSPVISKVGMPPKASLEQFGWGYSVSCMKISPNGKMLAFPVVGNLNMELFNFNNATGVVSNPRLILENIFVYGVSFSPNSEKLYTNARNSTGNDNPTPLLQFTVSEKAEQNKIVESKKIIAPFVGIGSMQIGPDKNIYLVENNKKFVSALLNPNSVTPQFVQQAVVFNDTYSSKTDYGLPNYMDHIFHSGSNPSQCQISGITSDTICENSFATFRDTLSNGNTVQWQWEFPGGNPSFSDEQNPTNIHYAKLGEYPVMLIRKKSDLTLDTAFTSILVRPLPIANAGNDLTVCSDTTAILGSKNPDDKASYRWTPLIGLSHPNIAQPVVVPAARSTEYFLQVTNEFGCTAYDTVIVSMGDQLPLTVSNDTMVCSGQGVQISAFSQEDNATYKWTPATGLSNASIQSPIATPLQTTTYYVSASSNGIFCPALDSVTITVLKIPELSTNDVSLCMGESRELLVMSDEANLTYSWTPSDGLNKTDIQNPTVTASKDQVYHVTATNQNGCSITTTLNVSIREMERITATAQTDKIEISPGETIPFKLLIRSANLLQGIRSFKAGITYEPKVFQFKEKTVKFTSGVDKSWLIKARQHDGILQIEANGQTPVTQAEITINLTAYLAKYTTENIYVVLEEIDSNVVQNTDCRTITTESTSLVLNKVCAGDLRLVNIGNFKTQLLKISPNTVSEETAEVEYSVGLEGNITLEIYNSQGELKQVVFNGNQKPGEYKEMLDLREFPSGIYMIKFTTLQHIQTQTFIVIK